MIQAYLTRRETFNLALVSKHFDALREPGNIIQHDAVRQKAEADDVLATGRPRSPDFEHPVLLAVIANGSNFTLVEQAVNIYNNVFPQCFHGNWGDEALVSPHFIAAMHGRADVVDLLFQNRWVGQAQPMRSWERWQELIMAGEGVREPQLNGAVGNLLMPSISIMIDYLPGTLMYAMYGAQEDLALLLVRHFALQYDHTTIGPVVPPIAISGLIYLAARMNMPRLVAQLLSWGGPSLWTAPAGAQRPPLLLDVVIQVAAEGTRELPWHERLKDQGMLTQDSHADVLDLVWAAREESLGGPQPFQSGLGVVYSAVEHTAPNNAVHVLRKTLESGVTLTPAMALAILRVALIHASECLDDMLRFIREMHPAQTASWLREREEGAKNSPPSPRWPNAAAGPPVENHLPSISSRMLSLAIYHGGVEYARYFLSNGAVPDEDHVMQAIWMGYRAGHTPATFVAEKSDVINMLVDAGLDVVEPQPRRYYTYGAWADITLDTIRENGDIPDCIVSPPWSILEVAVTQCLSRFDFYGRADFQQARFLTIPANVLGSVQPFCRIVYHFVSRGGQAPLASELFRKRLLALGLTFWTPGWGFLPDGEARWEMKWEAAFANEYSLQQPNTELAQRARDGRWQPDRSVLTGRGGNLHEQVLAAIMLLIGPKTFFEMAEDWCKPSA